MYYYIRIRYTIQMHLLQKKINRNIPFFEVVASNDFITMYLTYTVIYERMIFLMPKTEQNNWREPHCSNCCLFQNNDF